MRALATPISERSCAKLESTHGLLRVRTEGGAEVRWMAEGAEGPRFVPGPLVLCVPAGPAKVAVKQGGASEQRTAVVPAGGEVEILANLPVLAEAPGRRHSEPSYFLAPRKLELDLGAPPPPPPPPPSTWERDWGWSLLGAGVAVAGAGVAVLAVAEGKMIDANALDDAQATNPESCGSACEKRRDAMWEDAEALRPWGWAAVGVGAAASITGAVFLVMDATKGEEPSQRAVVPLVSPGSLGLAIAF